MKRLLHISIVVFVHVSCSFNVGSIVIMDFTKLSINCYVEKDKIQARSLIQCARECALTDSCEGLQFSIDSNNCSRENNSSGECIHLLQTEFAQATKFKNNTIIISKTGNLNAKIVKQCYLPPNPDLADSTIPTLTIASNECTITGAVFMNMTGQIMMFSKKFVYIYNSSEMLGTYTFEKRLISDIFKDLPGPVQAGYTNKAIYLVVDKNVYTYSNVKGASSAKIETIYEHFLPHVPSQIDGLIVNGSVLHLFSKNYLYDASSDPIIIKPFHSRSIYNPYRTTYRKNRPDNVDSATGISNDTFLFIDKKTFFLFQIHSLEIGTHAGKWIKGKSPLKC